MNYLSNQGTLLCTEVVLCGVLCLCVDCPWWYCVVCCVSVLTFQDGTLWCVVSVLTVQGGTLVCCVSVLSVQRGYSVVCCQCVDCPGWYSGVLCQCVVCPERVLCGVLSVCWLSRVVLWCVVSVPCHVFLAYVCSCPYVLIVSVVLQPPASLYTHMSAPPSYMYGSRSRHYPMSLDYPPPQPLPPHSRSSRSAVDKRSVVSFTSASSSNLQKQMCEWKLLYHVSHDSGWFCVTMWALYVGRDSWCRSMSVIWQSWQWVVFVL